MRRPSRLREIVAVILLAGSASAQITIDILFVPTSLLRATPGNPVDEVDGVLFCLSRS